MLNPKVIAIVFAFWGSVGFAQDQIDVPIDQASGIAAQALVSGETAVALEIAEAVLRVRPDDRTAWIVVAAAAPRVGDAAKGRRAGARAWSLSQTDAQKYEAARLTALAAANEERFTLSTFWLRRALTVAPNDAERTRTIQDARAVTRRNPWSIQVSASLTPSNNLNGGADEQSNAVVDTPFGETIERFSEDSLALRGWRGSFDVNAAYRLQEAPRSRTIVGLRYQLNRAWITEETNVPDESLDTDLKEFNLRHDRVLENGTISARYAFSRLSYRDLDLDAGTTTGESYDIWRLGIERAFPLNDRTSLSFTVQREWLTYSIENIGEVDRTTIAAGASYRLNNGDRVTANLSVSDSVGDLVTYTSTNPSLSVGYGWSDPIGPVTLSVGGGVRWADYPDYVIGFSVIDGGRQDTTIFAGANIGFPNISYAGFTPGLRIDASKTESNVSRFDRTTYSAGLTISSQF